MRLALGQVEVVLREFCWNSFELKVEGFFFK